MCIQSWITCLDVAENDATLFALESSHKYHKECGEKFSIVDKSDWHVLTDEETKFYMEKNCTPVRISCAKGDMVFWDSRTIHCGCEAIKGRDNPNFRAVIYLCYMPRKGAKDARIEAKKKAFNELRTTRHNPQKSLLFGVNPYDRGNPPPEINPIEAPIVGKLGRKLAGF